jgi:NADPH-dependent curcumin reductase CurA
LQAITAFSVGRVIRSKDSNYKEGDLVLKISPVAEYYVVPAELLIRKVDPSSGVPLPDFLSSLGNIFFLGFLLGRFLLLGIIYLNLNFYPLKLFVLCITGVPGFAAWVGIEVLADPKPGSNVFISAAAGAVGMYAGQLAKLKGCRVIGSTGSDEKVCGQP